MPANIDPIFTKTPNIGFGNIVTGNTDRTAASGTTLLVFTAGTNGSFLRNITAKLCHTASSNAASVLRIFINDNTGTAATDQFLVREYTIPSLTFSDSAALLDIDIPMNIALPPSWRVYVTVGTTITGTNPNLSVAAFGGDF